jgi:putative transcriptional regulator
VSSTSSGPSPEPPSIRGRLLVATPSLTDPNFARAVVLMLEHGADGALGVVLNRPTDAVLHDVLPDWAAAGAPPAVVYVGGPVAPDAAIALAAGPALGSSAGSADRFAEPFAELFDGVGTVDLGRDEAREHIDRLRVFAGYAGWGAGQLESEVAEGSWFVVAATPLEDVFCEAPGELWATVLRRQGGRVAWFANFPPDPTSN